MTLLTPQIDVNSLFKVEGLIAVITGGGSGESLCYRHVCSAVACALSL